MMEFEQDGQHEKQEKPENNDKQYQKSEDLESLAFADGCSCLLLSREEDKDDFLPLFWINEEGWIGHRSHLQKQGRVPFAHKRQYFLHILFNSKSCMVGEGSKECPAGTALNASFTGISWLKKVPKDAELLAQLIRQNGSTAERVQTGEVARIRSQGKPCCPKHGFRLVKCQRKDILCKSCPHDQPSQTDIYECPAWRDVKSNLACDGCTRCRVSCEICVDNY